MRTRGRGLQGNPGKFGSPVQPRGPRGSGVCGRRVWSQHTCEHSGLGKRESPGKGRKSGLLSRGVGAEKGRLTKLPGRSDSTVPGTVPGGPVRDITGFVEEPCKVGGRERYVREVAARGPVSFRFLRVGVGAWGALGREVGGTRMGERRAVMGGRVRGAGKERGQRG